MHSLAHHHRSLQSSAESWERKLQEAGLLRRALLLDGAGGAPSGGGEDLSPLVRTHYVRSLLDWAASSVAKREPREQQDPVPAGLPKLEPECWATVRLALSDGAVPSSTPLPAALLPALVAAVHITLRQPQLAGEGERVGGGGALAWQLAELVAVLRGKFRHSFRPGLEHCTALVEAALQGWEALHASAAWQGLAANAVLLLLDACTDHPNQRKPWEAVVPRLLLPLARGAWPSGGPADPAPCSLACRQVLQAVLFNQAHIPAVAATCAAELGTAGGAQDVEPPEAGASEHRTYAARLLQELRRGASSEARAPVLRLIPWLLPCFCEGLAKYKRSAQADAVLAGVASERRASHQDDAPAVGGVSSSADFQMFSCLLQLLLPTLSAEKPAEEDAEMLRAVAGLVEALKSCHIYRPTEDVDGANRAVLEELTTTTVAAAERRQSARAEGAASVADALAVIRAVLAVEHRAVQQHLPCLWPLLWSGVPAEQAAPTPSLSTGVACSLVGAYAELRQLELLLQSLVAALHAEAAAESAAAQAAATVLCSAAFNRQLAAAMAQLPSGQVASVPGLVAAGVPQLVALGPSSALVPVLAQVYCCCLVNMHVGLTTASTVASACQALLAALAPPLLPLLQSAADGGLGLTGAMLPALLQLYNACIEIHVQCSNLHPEVVPLPGLHIKPLPDGSQDGKGYFDSIALPGQAPPPPFPALLAALQADKGRLPASTALVMAVMEAGLKWLEHLHTRRAYAEHSCQLQREGTSGQEGALAGPSARPEASDSELQALATLMTSTAATALRQAQEGGWAGEVGRAACALLQPTLASAQLLQSWAAEEELTTLLQLCLRQASTASASSDGSRARQACLQMLCNVEFAEWGRLAAALPLAVAQELQRAASAPASGKSKKSKRSNSSGLKQQVTIESSELAKECVALASQAAALPDATTAASRSTRKRKKPAKEEAGAGEAGAGEAPTDLLLLLGQMALGHLPEQEAAQLVSAVSSGMLSAINAAVQALAAGDQEVESAVASSALNSAAATLRTAVACCQRLPDLMREWLHATPQICKAGGSICTAANSPATAAAYEALLQSGQRLMAQGASASSGSELSAVLQQLSSELEVCSKAAPTPRQLLHAQTAAALAEACLSGLAAHDDGAGAAGADGNTMLDLWCGPAKPERDGGHPDVHGAAASLEAAATSALAGVAGEKAAASGSRQRQRLLGSLYGVLAQILRLSCASPAPEAAGGSGAASTSGATVKSMGSHLQAVWELFEGDGLEGPVQLQLIGFIEACCVATQCMKPAPTAQHYGSMLALLVHLLGALPALPAALEPTRHYLPLCALFPAANGASKAAALRRAALAALWRLLGDGTTQQLDEALKFLQASLPAAAGDAGRALPLAELALSLLEAHERGRAAQQLGQHSGRLLLALSDFVTAAAQTGGPVDSGALQGSAAGGAQLLREVLAASGGSPAGEAGPQAGRQPPGGGAGGADNAAPPPVAHVAALCTALRALESMVGRPRLFAATPRHVAHALQCVIDLWEVYATTSRFAGAGQALYRLDVRSGAALFTGSCSLLSALLRQRPEDVRRCVPLLLQAARALLAFLVAAEAAVRLQRGGPSPPAGDPSWSVRCGEALAAVFDEIANLKATTGRYCPHLLADYLLLACSPLTQKSRSMLRLLGPASDPAPGAHEFSGELLPAATGAALRQGAYALYGACSPAELQYLYASLGQKGGAAWRAALAALKADFERQFKYSGKV